MTTRTAKFILPAISLSTFLGGCIDLTQPSDLHAAAPAKKTVTVEPLKPTPIAPKPDRPTLPPRPSVAPAKGDVATVTASHILIAYKGGSRAKPNVTRTKEEAKTLATRLTKEAKGGKDFAALAKKNSDGPSGPRGGDLGTFRKGQMVPAFNDAVFALKPGGGAGPVETGFGFHVIKRVK